MTEVEPLGKRISILYRYARAYIDNRLKPYNLGSGQYLFLANLYGNDGISQDKLTNIVKVDRATTARAIDKLTAEGYIRKEINPLDKRTFLLYATKKGIDFSHELNRILDDWDKIILKGFNAEETEILLELLERAKENALNATE